MILEHLEVLDVVPEPVAVGPHAHAGRIGDEPEGGAVLTAARERTEAQFRVRLGDAVRVRERGLVLDRDQHSRLSSLLLLHLGVGAGQDDTRREVGAAELAADGVDAREHLAEQRRRAREDRVAARL